MYPTTVLEAKIKLLLEAQSYQVVNAPNEKKDASAELDIAGKSAETIANLMHQDICTHTKQMIANVMRAKQVPMLQSMDWYVQFNVNAEQSTLFWSIGAFVKA